MRYESRRRRQIRRLQRWTTVLMWVWFVYCVTIFIIFANNPPR